MRRYSLAVLCALCLASACAQTGGNSTGSDKPPIKEQIKEGGKETWQDFKQGARTTGQAFGKAGRDIKDEAVESTEKVKKDFSR